MHQFGGTSELHSEAVAKSLAAAADMFARHFEQIILVCSSVPPIEWALKPDGPGRRKFVCFHPTRGPEDVVSLQRSSSQSCTIDLACATVHPSEDGTYTFSLFC